MKKHIYSDIHLMNDSASPPVCAVEPIDSSVASVDVSFTERAETHYPQHVARKTHRRLSMPASKSLRNQSKTSLDSDQIYALKLHEEMNWAKRVRSSRSKKDVPEKETKLALLARMSNPKTKKRRSSVFKIQEQIMTDYDRYVSLFKR